MIIKKKHPSTLKKPVQVQKVQTPRNPFPIARHCHYGMWTDDGRRVINRAGDIIYPVIERRKR
jgi:hypothetical protein